MLEVEDGWYTGTTRSRVPHGYGSLVFKAGVKYMPKLINWIGDHY